MSKETHELVSYLKRFIVKNRLDLFEEKIQYRTQHITVVLENIFQGRNISASIRSADCFGIQDIHIIENNNSFNDDVEVSIGAEKWVTTSRYNKKRNNTATAIQKLKSEGYEIIATTPHKNKYNLYDIDIGKRKTALIFGSEIKGCSTKALELADRKMTIPMFGFTESFNISVAVSLCLQHLTYKMRQSKINWTLDPENKEKVMLQWLRNSIKASKQIEDKYLSKNNNK